MLEKRVKLFYQFSQSFPISQHYRIFFRFSVALEWPNNKDL